MLLPLENFKLKFKFLKAWAKAYFKLIKVIFNVQDKPARNVLLKPEKDTTIDFDVGELEFLSFVTYYLHVCSQIHID